MIGTSTLKIVHGFVRVTSYLKLNCFTWDGEYNGIGTESPTTSILGLIKINRLGLKVSSGFIIANFIYGVMRIVQSLVYLQLPFQSIFFQLFVLGLSLLNATLMTYFLYNMEEFGKWFSMLIRYERKVTSKLELNL